MNEPRISECRDAREEAQKAFKQLLDNFEDLKANEQVEMIQKLVEAAMGSSKRRVESAERDVRRHEKNLEAAREDRSKVEALAVALGGPTGKAK